jgi:predicted ArsR family transcriptional regulator
MTDTSTAEVPVAEIDVPLERDGFCRDIIRELSGALEEMVGLDEATGFISVVGQSIGKQINQYYLDALGTSRLNQEQIGEVLVDLKRRIKGGFYIIEQDDTKIVFGNRACPFAEKVKDRPSLCMMTSNVFGTITAKNNGYAKVCLQETIARGADACRVTVYLQPGDEAEATDGRVYLD